MKKNRRRIYFIEKKFQGQFIIKFCLLVITGSLVTVAILYFFASKFTTVSFENTKAVVKSTADFILPILLQTVIIVAVLVAIFTIMLTLFISHKIAGPLYRFKKEFKVIEDGDLRTGFRLRANDQLQDLAVALNQMKAKLRSSIIELKSDLQNLEGITLNVMLDQEKKKSLDEKLNKLKDNLDYFKV